MHLVFYDGSCGFCDRSVQFILKRDPHRKFKFAPLQGETAKKYLKATPEDDTLVLIENFGSPHPTTYTLGKGAFRILWLLGLPWSMLGILNFFPSFLYNWGYRFIARHRHSLAKESCTIPSPSDRSRFLP